VYNPSLTVPVLDYVYLPRIREGFDASYIRTGS